MKNNKISLTLLLSMFTTSFTQSTTIIIDTNKIMCSFNQHMRAFDDYFNALQDEMYEMAESMNKVCQVVEEEQEKKSALSQLLCDIEDKADADNVFIEAKGINLDPSASIQAKVEFDDNEEPTGLLVEFADQRIHLSYTPQYRFLSVEMKHETKEEQKRDQQVTQFVQLGTARHGKTLRDDIKLDQARITYDKKEGMLTVAIPKAIKEKMEKIIPINVK